MKFKLEVTEEQFKLLITSLGIAAVEDAKISERATDLLTELVSQKVTADDDAMVGE